WDVSEERRNAALEDAIVKTVAAFLNCDGGTLLIGVGPDRSLVGLEPDYEQVKPQNADGFVNWLTTHLKNAVGSASVLRTRPLRRLAERLLLKMVHPEMYQRLRLISASELERRPERKRKARTTGGRKRTCRQSRCLQNVRDRGLERPVWFLPADVKRGIEKL